MKYLRIFYDHFGILRPFGVFYGHLVYFVVIWYVHIYFPILVCYTDKNLATLSRSPAQLQYNQSTTTHRNQVRLCRPCRRSLVESFPLGSRCAVRSNTARVNK
jgi:hypothetical protein